MITTLTNTSSAADAFLVVVEPTSNSTTGEAVDANSPDVHTRTITPYGSLTGNRVPTGRANGLPTQKYSSGSDSLRQSSPGLANYHLGYHG